MMVAGDGENDLPLFEITHSGVRGVIVQNACARLKQWCLRVRAQERRGGGAEIKRKQSHASTHGARMDSTNGLHLTAQKDCI